MNTTALNQWADLPSELLKTISNLLDSPLDVLRFRSVCSSWHSSSSKPCFDRKTPPVTVNLPHLPFETVFSRSRICLLELLSLRNPSSSYKEEEVEKSKRWLVKVQETSKGKLRLVHPLSGQIITYPPIRLNLLDVRIVELCQAFTLRSSCGSSVVGVNKVVLFQESKSCIRDRLAFLVIFQEGKLGYWRHGDKDWALLGDEKFQYDDIIVHKGQFYVVDCWGTVSWIDSSLRVVQYSPPLYGCGGKKNLVESCGDLYVVDRYLDGERRKWIGNFYANNHRFNPYHQALRLRYRNVTPKTEAFRVFKLDEDWGTWIDVKSLGDRIFVLGVECCFSISCGELGGGKGNCIYFTDDDIYIGGRLRADYIQVFQLEDGRIETLDMPQYSHIFWPPKHRTVSST
ncbi:hypothetical protein K2173_006168 [Erythroxylum novogranatense]|uniref:F-box domain-containing protein n=1 Tax=Erythroxylum novogranatense TaxID=1862640 RepID=A0AAV8TCS1_9ROSI|nr:hypothetical protein K2173_006168 [Erythroxylum novogranatense]